MNIQKLEENSISLHRALSLYLVHSKYETFLFAVFQEQLNNLSHFGGFCVPIVELCPSLGYCFFFCQSLNHGFATAMVFHIRSNPAFSAIFLVNEFVLANG